MKFAVILAAAHAAFGFASARAETRAATPALAKTVTVFAAASLKNALDDVAAAYKVETGVDAVVSFASSMTLAKQIEAGGPAEVFVSADSASMDFLAERRLIDADSRFDLLGNRLVVVAPAAATLQELAFSKDAFLAALGDGRIATGDPASVPAGKYAKAAFETLGLWTALEARCAFADTVRSALLFVSRGEAQLGVVYATDARAEPRVKIVASFPAQSHPAIVYPAAATAVASTKARAFLEFLRGPQAKSVFLRHGFVYLPRS